MDNMGPPVYRKGEDRAIQRVVFDLPQTLWPSEIARTAAWEAVQEKFPKLKIVPINRLIEIHEEKSGKTLGRERFFGDYAKMKLLNVPAAAVEYAWGADAMTKKDSHYDVMKLRYDYATWTNTQAQALREIGRRTPVCKEKAFLDMREAYGQAFMANLKKTHHTDVALNELHIQGFRVGIFMNCLPLDFDACVAWRLGFLGTRPVDYEVAKPGNGEDRVAKLLKIAGVTADGKGDHTHQTLFVGVRGTRNMEVARELGMICIDWEPSAVPKGLTYRKGFEGHKFPTVCHDIADIPKAAAEMSRYVEKMEEGLGCKWEDMFGKSAVEARIKATEAMGAETKTPVEANNASC